MRKSLFLLLTLPLQISVESCHPDQQEKVHGTDIETIIETPYKHPEAKKVGDLMPIIPFGKEVSYNFTYGFDRRTGKVINGGLIVGYDKDGDKIPEYEFVGRSCDFHKDIITYAVLDVPNGTLYVDSSRDGRIDLIVEDIDSLEGKVWPMMQTCEQEKWLSV